MKNVDNFKELDRNKNPKPKVIPNVDRDYIRHDINSVPIDQTSISETQKEIANREAEE